MCVVFFCGKICFLCATHKFTKILAELLGNHFGGLQRATTLFSRFPQGARTLAQLEATYEAYFRVFLEILCFFTALRFLPFSLADSAVMFFGMYELFHMLKIAYGWLHAIAGVREND